eukprot:5125291-Lingulodinium_polyedra.AAC.1
MRGWFVITRKARGVRGRAQMDKSTARSDGTKLNAGPRLRGVGSAFPTRAAVQRARVYPLP